MWTTTRDKNKYYFFINNELCYGSRPHFSSPLTCINAINILILCENVKIRSSFIYCKLILVTHYKND